MSRDSKARLALHGGGDDSPDPTGIRITAEEYVELEQGVKPLANTLKRHAQICGALELQGRDRKALEIARADLAELLSAGPRMISLPDRLTHAARVCIRLRHRNLLQLQADEKAQHVEPNPDTSTRLETCGLIAAKLGLELDTVVHSPKAAETDPRQTDLTEPPDDGGNGPLDRGEDASE